MNIINAKKAVLNKTATLSKMKKIIILTLCMILLIPSVFAMCKIRYLPEFDYGNNNYTKYHIYIEDNYFCACNNIRWIYTDKIEMCLSELGEQKGYPYYNSPVMFYGEYDNRYSTIFWFANISSEIGADRV